MILLWGAPGDAPLDAVREALARRGAAVYFLDQRHAADTTVVLQVDPGGRVSGEDSHGPDGESFDLDSGGGRSYLWPTKHECFRHGRVADPVYRVLTLTRPSSPGRTLRRGSREPAGGDGGEQRQALPVRA